MTARVTAAAVIMVVVVVVVAAVPVYALFDLYGIGGHLVDSGGDTIDSRSQSFQTDDSSSSSSSSSSRR